MHAQELLDPHGGAKRCDLLLALGEALLPAGQPMRAAELIAPEALAIAERIGDGRRAAQACLLALEGLFRHGRASTLGTPARRQWAERADRCAAPGTADRARADMFLAMERIHDGLVGAGRILLNRALTLARELDDVETLFRVSELFLNWGRPEDAEEQSRLAEEVIQWSRDRVRTGLAGDVLWRCGITLLNRGERERTEALWREVAELAARTRVASSGSVVREIWQATLDGNLEAAVALGPRLLAQAEEVGTPVAGLLSVHLATCGPLLYLGRAEEALAALLAAGRVAGAQQTISVREFYGLCLARLGRRSEAQEALNRFVAGLAAGPAAEDGLTFAMTTWLETAVLLEDRQAALSLGQRLIPVAGRASSTAYTVPTCIARHLAAAAALLGDPAAARQYAEQALDLAGRMRHRPEIALAHLQLAGLLSEPAGSGQSAAGKGGAKRAEALSHLDFAIGELRQMRMQHALERALRLRARAGRSAPLRNVERDVYPDGLTAREVEVLRLVAAGRSNREIAAALVITVSTVFQHVHSILGKTGTVNRTQAAAYARRRGLVE